MYLNKRIQNSAKTVYPEEAFVIAISVVRMALKNVNLFDIHIDVEYW